MGFGVALVVGGSSWWIYGFSGGVFVGFLCVGDGGGVCMVLERLLIFFFFFFVIVEVCGCGWLSSSFSCGGYWRDRDREERKERKERDGRREKNEFFYNILLGCM